MRLSIKNQLIMNGGEVVAEIAPVRKGWRTWIAVGGVATEFLLNPLRPSGVLHIPGLDLRKVSLDRKFIFTLKRVSVDEEYLRNGWDVGGNEFIDLFLITYSFDELIEALANLGVDTDGLIEAWNSDYPL